MRVLCTSAVALILLAAAPAFADQVLDLSTIECRQFTDYNSDNGALIMTYLEAYYLDENDQPVLNFTKMKSDVAKLMKFCHDNPTVGLITAADKLMGKSKSR